MIKPIPLLACASIVTIPACAVQPGAPPAYFSHAPQCFRANEVFGYTSAPDGSVQLQTAQGPFEIRLDRSCPDFSWVMQVGIRPADSPWLCEGEPQQIITAYESQFSRCQITDIESLARSALPA
jgi:hypothetical protein